MSIANLITRTFTGAAAAAVLAFGFSAGAAAADKVIRIGVTPVPHADIVNFIKPQLEKEGVKLEVVEFNDTFSPISLWIRRTWMPTTSRRFLILKSL